jgi:deoxyribodipyrimidine photo-lyase
VPTITDQLYKTANKDLRRFLQGPISSYDNLRNFDFGADDRRNVSCLSKYISHRVLIEYDIITQSMALHRYDDVEKFVQEVFWRVYWKGWLEHRPTVWDDFISFDLSNVSNFNYQNAIKGETGIRCFDSWVNELQDRNYLHNHTRMWFASIWIFTLGLPWQLGARFFMHHLLDGDAASNTLGWRWVAGVQTTGRHYLARSSNILRYTDGRFGDDTLNEDAEPFIDNAIHNVIPIDSAGRMTRKFDTLIVFDTDLHLESEKAYEDYERVLVVCLSNDERSISLGEKVLGFKRSLITDFAARCQNASLCDPSNIMEMASISDGVDVVYPFIGDNLDYLKRLQSKTNLTLHIRKRAEDLHCWHYAKKGFFNFKRHIPSIINTLGLQT